MTDLIDEKRTGQPLTDRSTAELVKLASEQISRLVRDEMRLAQAELGRKARYAGIAAGLFSGAGVLTVYGVAVLVATAVLALALVLPGWLAALIVGCVLLALAGVLALVGRSQIKRAGGMPAETVVSVKEDIGTVAEAVRERGRR
jgi:hypothetical protein